MIEQPDPVLAKLVIDTVAIEKDRDRWRRALNDCTPGGSEFARDPAYCAEWVKSARNNMWETAKKNILENRRLREILESSITAFRLVRDGAEGPEIRTLARDLVNQLEEFHVGRKQTQGSPGPDDALNSIARKERI